MGENLPALSSPFPTEFAPITKEAHWTGSGDAYRFRFPNNFGASVVRNEISYGGRSGAWELAVLSFEGDEWELCYTTVVTEDVIGWLDEQEVAEKLAVIARLDSNGRLPLLEGEKPKLKEDHQITWEHADDYAPEQGGVVVDITVKRRATVEFPDIDEKFVVWVEVDSILSEVMNPWEDEEIHDVMRYNYPQAFENGE